VNETGPGQSDDAAAFLPDPAADPAELGPSERDLAVDAMPTWQEAVGAPRWRSRS